MKETMIERLQAKTATEALVERVRQDFNLSPVVARTLLEQMHHYIDGYTRMPQETGQMKYLAVSKQSPAGRKVSECKRIPVTLTLHNTDDLIALGNGVAVLRQQRILRLTEEAYDQGALLTHEDLACLLSTSLATVKRDVAALRGQDLHVPTRGQIKDIGKGVSHKSQIVQDYLDGYTFSEIEHRRHHSISSIRRYCQDFVRVARLAQKEFSSAQIRQATRLSERLINEYLTIYRACDQSSNRFQLLMTDPDPATNVPAEIKRGDWLV